MNLKEIVIAGLDPALHGFATVWNDAEKGVDHRVKPVYYDCW